MSLVCHVEVLNGILSKFCIEKDIEISNDY